MKLLNILTTILLPMIMQLFSLPVIAQNVSLNVTGLRNTKGQIVVSVFKDQSSFKAETPAQKIPFPKLTTTNSVLKINLTLEPGTYGLALVDDENANNKMDKNMFGIPKEGFGFSNFYLSGMSRPSFNDFKFDVKGSTPVKLESKLRYM